MKANELRIGNIIALQDGSCFEVSAETFSAPAFPANIEGNFVPLLLTKEWLLMLGFEETGKNVFSLRSYPELLVRAWNDEFELVLNGKLLFTRSFNVHRFQNLVFEITGEALPVKEIKDESEEAIEIVADGILYQYVPADPAQQKLSFDLSIEGGLYHVNYKKDGEGFWKFDGYNKK